MSRFLLIFFAISQIGLCSCPDGFELVYNGECRGSVGIFSLSFDKAVDTAIDKCNAIQAHPIIIHNDEENSFWNGRADPSGNNPILLLGIVCDLNSKKWMWVDGSDVDFIPPGSDPALNNPCTDDRFFHIAQLQFRFWIGSTYPTDISCTKQIRTPLNDDACDYFEDDTEDDVCYQVGATAEDWQDAQMSCKKLGANLASIHNPQENSFLRRLAVSQGIVTGLLLGSTMSGKGDEFGWIDGTDWDYENFAPGFPKLGFGEYIVMDTSTPAGQWKNIDYSEKYPVACIREQKKPTEYVCSTDVWKEGAIITSPGFPYNASTPCDFYLLVEEGKRVEVEIILLEANSCCDNFILYDGYVGGVVLANLTGAISNATYTTTSSHKMVVSWQPNGGVNVMGLAMTFRGV